MRGRGVVPLLDDMSLLPRMPIAGDIYAERPAIEEPRTNALIEAEPIGDWQPRDEGDEKLLRRLWLVWPRGPAAHVMDWRVSP